MGNIPTIGIPDSYTHALSRISACYYPIGRIADTILRELVGESIVAQFLA
jgi:hypothetical protein